MSSLRARLIAVLLVVAAGGLLALAGITYAEQRSFLLERVDAQLSTAVPAMEHQLIGDRGGRGEPRGGGPRPGDVNLPPGTYGELRDASGDRIAGPEVITYGQVPPDPPELPADLPYDRAVTVPRAGSWTIACGRPPFATESARSSWPCRSRRPTRRSTACCSSRPS